MGFVKGVLTSGGVIVGGLTTVFLLARGCDYAFQENPPGVSDKSQFLDGASFGFISAQPGETGKNAGKAVREAGDYLATEGSAFLDELFRKDYELTGDFELAPDPFDPKNADYYDLMARIDKSLAQTEGELPTLITPVEDAPDAVDPEAEESCKPQEEPEPVVEPG